ncbi:MAG: type IX secretion system sortase PorU [Bacteroides sp.]|nr:type IX secretion system sortase PorU [Ruminococcus flavefaciens]MCM1554933.1 type IX secretion system sortase PorU [Bacteroides sp.]
MKHFLALFLSLICCTGTMQAQTYPSPSARKSYSVLAAGQTLKVAVAQDAVYKIAYEDLVRHGLLSQPVASDKIAVYGNTAGMLPFLNTSGIYDDLSPLSILVSDGGDGIFGAGDYLLFYGQAPHRWTYNGSSGEFSYTRHYFCDSSFYFVSLNAELEHRVKPLSQTSNGGETITWFPEHIHHENDLINLRSGGFDWLGESFTFSGNSRSINLATPDPVSAQEGTLYVTTGAQSSGGTASFSVQLNQTTLHLYHGSTELPYTEASTKGNVQVNSGTSTVNIAFSKTGSTNNGYLDHLSLVYPRNLRLTGANLFFRQPKAIDNTVRFSLTAASGTQIWDISDVYNILSINSQQDNGRLNFSTEPDQTLHEYVAFNASLCPSPAFKELIQPQNLHQLQNIDYVVVTHPLFLEQAQEVARLHRERDGYTTCVATTEQVYNEFSSGAKDPSAIRMFLRHLDIRSDSAHKPLYLLLFGAASYDYKGILGETTDFVPTLASTNRSSEQNDPLEDSFGYLADGTGTTFSSSGYTMQGKIQVAIGRLPVHNVDEARNMVEKIDIYSSPNFVSDPAQPNLSGNFGNWRNEVVFVTDDGFESEMETRIINNNYIQNKLLYIHVNKLYSDAYERTTSSTSARIPALENAIKDFVENGCLFLGYEGHSGWDAWSDEKILTNNIIENWKKSYTYPVIFSSSCTFAYFDQPSQLSGAERAVLREHAGAIAVIASTRMATTGSIEDIQKRTVETFINKSKGEIKSIGQAFLYAKTTSSDQPLQKFVLLGDPGLKAPLPKHRVQTLHVNGKQADAADIDTLKALSPITIDGRITSDDGDPMNHFNGILSVKIYDKAITKQTLGVYNPQIHKYNTPYPYTDQSSIIFQGETEVKDGYFSFSFIVPKDIQYNYGNGRISYYAYNDETDANGSFDGIVVGGMNPNAVIDTTAPVVDLYINKNTFSGGTVGAAPSLYAEISDEYGINTTGAGIGHDMTLVIDNDYRNSIVVNNQFRYSTGSYKSGTLTYPLELTPGKHTAQLKVWNINNISTTQEITFNVNASDKLKLFNFKAVPNPARDGYVDFYFNHNSKNGGIERCTLSIFSLQGARVAEFNYTMNDLSGYTVGPLRWNLCGNGGKRVQAGVYVCYIKAVDAQGGTVHKDLKLIVVN